MGSDLRGMLPQEIADLLHGQGEPPYRGGQVFAWLQKEAVADYQQMSDVPKSLRAYLDETHPLIGLSHRSRIESADGTVKYLFSLADGGLVESVLMRHKEETGHIRHTVCLSCQVGCAMGCTFCATASLGFQRNLSAGEMVGQVLEIAALEKATIHNAVFMGMGEPLLNMDALKRSILLLCHPKGQNMGIRRITVSTCGLPDGIRQMAEWGLDLVLAVSLHAADDETRSRLMPINRRYPLKDLIGACRYYTEKTGRRMTFEYMMVKGVNMGGDVAEGLATLLKGIPCNINLIPINPGNHAFVRPGKREQMQLLRALGNAGFSAVIRQERGSDIQGACGQLAGGRKK